MGVADFRKALQKKDKFNLGLSPVVDWISTGNAALNRIISGDMLKGIAVGRVTALGGLNGTGKSFLVANIIREAQAKGYFTIYVDTEFATSDGFMEKIGVDMSEDKFMAVNTAILEDLTEFTSTLFKNMGKEDKVLLIIDSLSNCQTEGDTKKFDDGKIAYGVGLLQKLQKATINSICTRVGGKNMACVFTSHMYVSGTDTYGNQILKPNVGEGTMYLPSTVLQLSKKALKEGKEISGISVTATTLKSRFTKLGEKTSFDLPWDSGMDYYDGSLEVLEEAGTVDKNGSWYVYTDRETGEVCKFQSSSYKKHADKLFQYYSDDVGEVEEKSEEDANQEMLEASA